MTQIKLDKVFLVSTKSHTKIQQAIAWAQT